jgi:tetratricopeptide (TPR) repeat protein
MVSHESTTYLLNTTDTAELNKLVSFLQLSSGTTTIFAIAPESGPQHPIVEEVKSLLATSDADFYEPQNFFYSDNSLYNFIYSWNETEYQNSQNKRQLVMAFGIDQLPTSRLKQEMKQLNLGRDSLFDRELVIIFWLNKEEFLEEFRNRAPDFWDWRGKLVKFQTRPPVNPLFYPYLEWLIAENSYLKISGVMQVQRQVDIFLDQIYVSLQAVRRQEVTETSKLDEEMTTFRKAEHRLGMSISSLYELDEPSHYEPVLLSSIPATSTKTVTQRIDLSHAVQENQYCVILGAPGAGKTTLLRYLALHFATAKRDGNETVTGGEPQEELGKTLLPIFFRIADYAERLQQEPELSLLDYLRQFYCQWEAYFQDEGEAGTEMTTLLLEKMHQGQCLMLLDGLDEVFEQESRRLIVERIDLFVNAFSSNKFVITSRIAGYRDVKLSSRFGEFTIEDMGSEQVEKFLHRWCLAIERAQQPEANEAQWQRAGDDQARKILEAIKDNEGVKRLTANPLLLTILALIHRNGDRLPNRRVKLYELAVQTLTEDWQLGKKLPDAPKVLLKQNEVIAFLAPLAYWMHEEKPSGLLSEAEVEQQLAAKLAELNATDPESDSVHQAVQEFLRKVRETTGLFVERAPGIYGFMHLTFEEYFAALYIADNEPSDILKIIREHLHEARWNEPILLALGSYSNSSKLVNRLVEQLFSNIEAYEPAIKGGKLTIKNASLQDAIIIWSGSEEESTTNSKQSELRLKDLLFAGEVLTQVEVYPSTRKKIIHKLVLTYLCLDTDFDNDTTKQLLKLLRQIELFNQKNEVIEQLKELANDSILTEKRRIEAQVAILYIACGESGGLLVSHAIDIVNQLEPTIFCRLRELVKELGEDMTPTLEFSRQNHSSNQDSQQALTFLTAISYIRTDNYAKAVEIIEQINVQQNSSLSAYIAWAIATCYQEQDKLDRAIDYYQECFEKLAPYIHPSAFLLFWRNRGICHGLHTKYEQSLECFQQALAIDKEFCKSEDEASDLWNIGRAYQLWGKYEQAIAHYQQSRDLCKQLGQDKDVANLWRWLADCYREWGKYEQALECQQKCLTQRQKLEDEPGIASAYFQLGWIHQSWGKYEQAIAYHQQSRDLYEQLGKEEIVATMWYWLASCYREWGKYEQALECQQKCLVQRQRLEDQAGIASAYFQLGWIHQSWGKYEQAIAHHQQSCDLYEQLGKEKDVATMWYWLASCYREWGKYEQALECQQKCLVQRQRLEDQPGIASAFFQLGHIYQAWGKYEQAIAYFQQSRDLYEQLGQEKDLASQWYNLAGCYREWGKYEQALECGQKCLAQCQKLEYESGIARAYFQLGSIHQGWGKYEQAIAHYQQSRDLYEQLGKEKDVASRCYNIADCYRDWGKYERALEYQQHCLSIRQTLDDTSLIAVTYYQLGSIYQAWGKYEEAIAHYQQSRDLYEQLGKEKDIASRCYNIADCYRDWGKYERALEYQQHCLSIRQTLNDTSLIAVTYYQLGRIYQAWGKYEQVIAHYQQSCDLYEQLGKENDVANLWYFLADCYRDWGKYEQALEYQHHCLSIRQTLDDTSLIAVTYYQLGRIYQAWGKYEQAIAYFQQSRGLYEQLDKVKDVASQWDWLAYCYLNWGKYKQAVECQKQCLLLSQALENQPQIANAYYWLGRIYRAWDKYDQALEYFQQSYNLYQQLDLGEDVALSHRAIGESQRLLAKNTSDRAVAFELLAQAEQNIRRAIEITTTADYKQNLAYDYIIFSLIWSERLRLSFLNDSLPQEQIAQFEEYYNTGLTYLAELGETVNRADEALDVARAYLEVSLLKNLDRAEELAQESLQVFQEYNRRKLEASSRKLLGEIYLNRFQHHQSDTKVTATQFLTESLQIYRELDLSEKAAEVEQLMHPNLDNTQILSD